MESSPDCWGAWSRKNAKVKKEGWFDSQLSKKTFEVKARKKPWVMKWSRQPLGMGIIS